MCVKLCIHFFSFSSCQSEIVPVQQACWKYKYNNLFRCITKLREVDTVAFGARSRRLQLNAHIIWNTVDSVAEVICILTLKHIYNPNGCHLKKHQIIVQAICIITILMFVLMSSNSWKMAGRFFFIFFFIRVPSLDEYPWLFRLKINTFLNLIFLLPKGITYCLIKPYYPLLETLLTAERFLSGVI